MPQPEAMVLIGCNCTCVGERALTRAAFEGPIYFSFCTLLYGWLRLLHDSSTPAHSMTATHSDRVWPTTRLPPPQAHMRTITHGLLATVLLAIACQVSNSSASDGSALLSPGFHPLPCASSQSGSLCGRAYYPDFLSAANASLLLSLATTAFELSPGGSGPVTIVDMVSGALSYNEQFVNLFALLKRQHTFLPLPAVAEYLSLTARLSALLSSALQSTARLYLTRPSFFSRIRSADAANTHDEYWHRHVDREQYGTFEATALIYLSDWGSNFDGGELVFVDTATDITATDNEQRDVDVGAALDTDTAARAATTATTAAAAEEGHEWVIRPSMGALAFFSSGHDNVHYVRRVTAGTRYALTIAFTRNEEDSVEAKLHELYGQQLAEWRAGHGTQLERVDG